MSEPKFPDAASAFPSIGGDAPKVARKALRLTERTVKRRMERMSQRRSAREHLYPLPVPCETLHLAMDGRYSAWHLVTAALDLLGCRGARVVISTLGFNRENADDLIGLIDDGTIASAVLNVSTYFRSSDRDIFDHIRREMTARGQRVMVTRSHAKLVLIDAPPRSIVIEMSANLRSSQNWEQATVSDSAELLEFHRAWIADLHEEYNE